MVPVIVSILVPLLLYFLNKASKQHVAALDSGEYELRMNRAYLVISIAGALVGILFLLMPILADEYSVELFAVAGIMALLFLGFTIPCFMWYRNHFITYNEDGLTSKNAYGKEQKICWSDISRVSFNSFMGVISIVDKQGNITKAHQHLVGFSSLVEMLLIQKRKYHFTSESLPLKMLGLEK
jgi:hypothetical protein